MTCKHNWIEHKPKGAHPYVPETKQYNFRCVRCGNTTAALIKTKEPT